MGIAALISISAGGQISQGKARDRRSIYPPHLRSTDPDSIGLRVKWPSRPSVARLVCDSCSSGRSFAYSFFRTPPRGGSPCCSARSSRYQGLRRTFTFKSSCHAWHTSMKGPPAKAGEGPIQPYTLTSRAIWTRNAAMFRFCSSRETGSDSLAGIGVPITWTCPGSSSRTIRPFWSE